MTKIVSVHSIKMEGDSEWSRCFNRSSELFNLATDENNSEEDREKYWNEYTAVRYQLEQGYLSGVKDAL